MAIVKVLFGIGLGAALGYIGFVTLLSAVQYAFEARAALASVSDVGALDGGMAKVRGTVEADEAMPATVGDRPTVVSAIDRSTWTGGLGNDWDEQETLYRMVPFNLSDETGTVRVTATDDLHEDAFAHVETTAAVQVEADEDVPVAVDAAFEGGQRGWQVSRLDDPGVDDHNGTVTADGGEPVTGDGGIDARSLLNRGIRQRFVERSVSPGDEVYVVGSVETVDGETALTNGGLVFGVFEEPRRGAVFTSFGLTVFFALIALVSGAALFTLGRDLLALL